MTRIALDVRATDRHFPGIARATLGLLTGLHSSAQPFSLDLIANPTRPALAVRTALLGDARMQWHTVAPGPFSASQQWQLPRLARQVRPDCWHAPYLIRPFFALPPTVVTIYDLIGQRVAGALGARGRLLFAISVRLSLRTAREIVTSSLATKQDLIALHGVDPAQLHVIPLAADQRFAPQAAATIAELRDRYGLPERYVLYLGSNKPHKQPVVAVRAFAQLIERDPTLRGVRLVIAGRWDPRFPEAQQAASMLGQQVIFRPDVADADLPALLSGAEVFVFPSLYEGFGLPPLEAMACGTPVIAANRSSLPEVVGEAGLLVEPEVEAVATALAQVLHDPSLRVRLAEQGLQRAAQFSWQRTAEQMLAVYARCAVR